MCCNHKSVDLSLLDGVLAEYAGVKGSTITILQKTQEIYGYIHGGTAEQDAALWPLRLH